MIYIVKNKLFINCKLYYELFINSFGLIYILFRVYFAVQSTFVCW